jgi:hypothetical protein
LPANWGRHPGCFFRTSSRRHQAYENRRGQLPAVTRAGRQPRVELSQCSRTELPCKGSKRGLQGGIVDVFLCCSIQNFLTLQLLSVCAWCIEDHTYCSSVAKEIPSCISRVEERRKGRRRVRHGIREEGGGRLIESGRQEDGTPRIREKQVHT